MTATEEVHLDVDALLPGRGFLNFSKTAEDSKAPGLERSAALARPFSTDRPRSPPAHGTAKVTYPNGDLYEGSFEGGLRHGKGIMKFADGRQYRGKWRLGVPHGQGEEIRADRTSYKGEYYQGLWQGHGLEVSVYGDEYNGEWSHGERHGKGDFFSDGLHYEGEWRNGLRSGHGKCTFRNSDMYEGEFEKDLMHGEGTMVIATGCRYSGTWKEGRMDGRGQMLFPTGDKYEGEWLAGKKHGQGRYTSASGSVYEGHFENGKRHGRGVQRSVSATSSLYKTSHMPYKIDDGEMYDGEWMYGKRCGHAVVTIKGQTAYEGEFLNDKRDGYGTSYLKNGSKYVGAWKMGKKHGKGEQFFNGQSVRGIWEAGECMQTIESDFETMKRLERGEDGEMMQAFNKGKGRLEGNALSSMGGASYAEEQEDHFQDDMQGLQTEGLPFIAEGNEDYEQPMPPSSPEGGQNRQQTRGLGSSSAGSMQGERLPGIVTQSSAGRRTPGGAALVHDEQNLLSNRYGVPMRGTFDVSGNYIPPVSTDTLREWNLVNSSFAGNKDKRANANRKQAPGLSAAESVYKFEKHLAPGYGEGRSLKEAKSYVPRKTSAMEAGPGEFSFTRWRAERKA